MTTRYWTTFLLVGVLLCGGCANYYRKQADCVAHKMIASGQQAALGEDEKFDIRYKPFENTPDAQNVIIVGKKRIPLSGGETVRLSVEECLRIAFRNSRSFQDRKEELFSASLALSNARRSWEYPLADLELTGGAGHEKVHHGSETNFASGTGEISLTQRFVNGGIFSLAFALDAATDFVNSRSQTFGSLFEANFTQPLLRGAWRNFAYEDVYRLERDFLFDVFDYERFTQTFAVDIITRYYGVIRQRDQLENQRENIKRLKDTLALTRVQAEGGQVSRIQEDQAEQDLLNSQIRLQREEQSYRDAVDEFKLLLGLPLAANVTVDYPAAREDLIKIGPKPLDLKEGKAIGIALSVRPDVLVERAKVRDALRDVEIAADAFWPQLDLSLGLSAEDSGANRSARPRWSDHTRFVEVEFNYSFDQTDNRDFYRNTLLASDKAQRDLDLFEDRIRLAVRKSYRNLLQSRRSYELQLRSVEVARRRSKLAFEEQKEGQASARDVLEAEEALRDAQNGLTASLIDYTTTRLNFLAGIGMIAVDEKGRVNERTEPFGFDRIAKRYHYVSSR